MIITIIAGQHYWSTWPKIILENKKIYNVSCSNDNDWRLLNYRCLTRRKTLNVRIECEMPKSATSHQYAWIHFFYIMKFWSKVYAYWEDTGSGFELKSFMPICRVILRWQWSFKNFLGKMIQEHIQCGFDKHYKQTFFLFGIRLAPNSKSQQCVWLMNEKQNEQRIFCSYVLMTRGSHLQLTCVCTKIQTQ